MPQAKKTKQPSRTTAPAHARAEDDAQRLDRITQTLEVAQKDLASIGGSVGTGVRDLRRDVTKLLRDARRDLAKMRRAIQRDVDRLQKDVASAASPASGSKRAPAKASGNRRVAAASRKAAR